MTRARPSNCCRTSDDLPVARGPNRKKDFCDSSAGRSSFRFRSGTSDSIAEYPANQQ